MIHTSRSFSGMVVAPHHLAAEAGLSVLRDGGNAVEAMIAAASTIAVVYPHMNGIGGDGFWLIGKAGETPVGIEACGRAAYGADREWFASRGLEKMPARGPLAASTMAGTIAGWDRAYQMSRTRFGGRLPVSRLLRSAIRYAWEGSPVTDSLHNSIKSKLSDLVDVPGFADMYLRDGKPLPVGYRLRQPKLSDTLARLSQSEFDDFYRGELARSMASDLESLGSPLRLEDFQRHQATIVKPLQISVDGHTVYNLPPPTQGLASLLILALYARNPAASADSADHLHRLIEATKAAFRVRNAEVTDPAYMKVAAETFLDDENLSKLAATISEERAAPWPEPSKHGDTVWLAATDSRGLSVSFIQSIYWEFGSGVVLPGTGITWQNRGTSFDLKADGTNAYEPGRAPFHTIQPAMAELNDGRLMAYGTMGGEGQPQTQAAVFTRYAMHGVDLQASVTAPRWLLGRTWGEDSTNLKIESRFDPAVVSELRHRGHDVQTVGPFEEFMGHAGAIVRHSNGLLEGASDPRSDGAVAAH